MKTSATRSLRDSKQRAFTLPEILMASSVFLLVMSGMIGVHLFGLQMFKITKTKLGASDEARKAVSLLGIEIRTARTISVGTGSASVFNEAEVNSPQQGSAIQINSSTNTNHYIRYYWDPADHQLKRITQSSATPEVITSCILNNTIFSAEDHAGKVQTNSQNNRVIALNLEFYQLHDPSVPVGPGNYYEYYRLRTKMTRRTLE